MKARSLTMKKTLLIGLISAVCVIAAVIGIVVFNLSKKEAATDIPQTSRELLTELKVGKYYLEGGTDKQYIEVYDDHTICLFGYELDEDSEEIQIKESERFTERGYYFLHDVLPFIGVSDDPNPNDFPAVGYDYTGENVINFTAIIDHVHVYQKYVFRED